ncbi:hypothetical protein QYM36_011306 [Artemia franciscana]|uniref:non-specific serine/threonine protein kinase n=1 Tax=Artemia franciscana TaxID=6661 RepID=A0AA88L142_ARTSF|nr:hypothetical protein QYM36_011306 [Artemia franciscana]
MSDLVVMWFLGDIYHESTQELEVIPVTPLTPSSPMWTPHVDYDTELNNLQESFQKIVTSLLTDPDNHVKRGLVENGISQLCIFFGKQRANDVILSHMITFLNDKTDHQLRSSFFKAIVGVAAYIGWTCSTLLKPLLQQGLSDPEEYVIVNAIDAISGLAQLGLFQKPTLFEVVNEVAPLLVHPNSWIRMSAARFLSICARLFNAADVYGRLAKILKPFLKKQIISMESEFLLLYLALEPIPRPVFDSIVRLPKLKEFLDTLEKRKIARASGRELDLSNTEAVAPMKNIFGRLVAEGMTKQTEMLVLLLKDHLKKLHGHREATVAQKKITLTDLSGVLNLNLMKMLVPVYSADLCSFSSTKPSNGQKEKPIVSAPETPIVMNREWEKMLGVQHRRTDDEEGIAIATDVTSEEGGFNDSEISSKGTLLSMEDSVLSDSLISSHHQRLQEYISLKSAEYRSTMDSFDLSSRSLASRNIPSKWRPKAVLVAHLQEHSKAVNRLVCIPDTSFFASASSDGTVKLFDAIRFEANTVANRSRQTYDRCNGDPVTSLAASKDKLLLATEKGHMQVLSLENSRLIMSQSRQLDENNEGGTVDVSYCPSNHGNIFAYATAFGDIIGWDLRTPDVAWRLKHSLRDADKVLDFGTSGKMLRLGEDD